MGGGWGVTQWLLAVLVVTAGFFPVVTLRNLVARIACGVAAAGASALLVFCVFAGSRPDAGLAALGWAVGAMMALQVISVLFLVGLAGALSRGIAWIRGVPTPWWVTAAATVVVLGLTFGAAGLASTRQSNDFYQRNATIVAAARDSAGPQTQEQLTKRLLEGLAQTTAGDKPAVEKAAVDTLVAVWHPGALRAVEYFNLRPRQPKMSEHKPTFDFELVVHRLYGGRYAPADAQRDVPERSFSSEPTWTEVRPTYPASHYPYPLLPQGGRMMTYMQTWSFPRTQSHQPYGSDRPIIPSVKPGDTFDATWRGQVPFESIPELWRDRLSFYDDKRWDGRETQDGRLLFPGARYYRLDVSVIRNGQKMAFVDLFAVDDGGKWWFVGLEEPPG